MTSSSACILFDFFLLSGAAHQSKFAVSQRSSDSSKFLRGGNFPIFTVLPNFNCHATWWRWSPSVRLPESSIWIRPSVSKGPLFICFAIFCPVCVCFFSVTLNLPLNGPAIGCIVGQREFLGYLRLPRFVPPLSPTLPLRDRGIWTVVHCGFSLVSSGWTRLISENLIAFLLANCCPVFRFGFFVYFFFCSYPTVCQMLFELFGKWPAAFLYQFL